MWISCCYFSRGLWQPGSLLWAYEGKILARLGGLYHTWRYPRSHEIEHYSDREWRHTSVMTYQITGNSSVCFQRIVRTGSKETPQLPIAGLLWEKSTDHWWIPLTKGYIYSSLSMSWRHINVFSCSFRTMRSLLFPGWFHQRFNNIV